jgi:sortase (surface protein transpeptidase)
MNRQRFTRRSVVAAIAVAVGLLAVMTGCAPVAQAERQATPSQTVAPERVEPKPVNTDSLALLSLQNTSPVTISMPALDIEMPIEPHGLDVEGQMSLPESPFSGAWYQYGSAPDSIQGSTVIAAHVDSRVYGVGPFARLREAQAGMAITVTDQAGVVHTYSVVAVERTLKAEVDLSKVFTAVGDPHLVLITCGGEFIEEIRNYTDNYIVTAEKVS